ncbi:hypothetical protein [uncultured Cardiobacterium sp.]|uniref:DUF7210 family protein n=1 Tax=uncultured Cardiobacterium sp. TaxID=417619 RepID=UPI00261FDE2A|nr:hypothetical protein [uncultured Cardiobacterium sp.]
MRYTVLQPLRHNGTRYEAGDVIDDIDDAVAAGLIERGLILLADIGEALQQDIAPAPANEPEPANAPPAEAHEPTEAANDPVAVEGELELTPEVVVGILYEEKPDRKPTLKKAVEMLERHRDAGTTEDGIRLTIDPQTLTQEMLDTAWILYLDPGDAA